MSRGNLLLALTLSSGGKLVNIITLKPYIERASLQIEYNTLFPVTSGIKIAISTNGIDGLPHLRLYEGASGGVWNDVDLGPSTPEITVRSITPSEDDNYIYEVVIEY